ncbi:SAM-dependent methyltransferase [Arthrobacter sp. RIT-PI-e]|uniref:spermidine synthase n=1 Tax=Arthrobacter sp. RIT-PI-e TaxID=1681197 RepID=UPI0006764186|nr:fused MFS/spermidine synthase [Arthrobacter sp. RIT-PI-e]KNC18534.1 SAM-dependent methyltransferase [Arthrobacter sp. RIT-PI-e]
MNGVPEPEHDGDFEVPTRWLSGIGAYAELDEDAFIDGALILSIGGAQQSHVDVRRPERVFYEYLQRIAHVLDLVRPAGTPLRVLHQGAGALTLVRYVQATRPGSAQVAVDIEGELMEFVLETIPLAPGTDCSIVVDDAAATVRDQPDGAFDAVVLDIFAGADAPAHLTGPGFAADLLRICAEDGVLLVNVGDDPPLRFAREQSRQLTSLAASTAVLTEAGMVGGALAGNVVVAARRSSWPASWTTTLLERGPHPAAVLVGTGREEFERGW